MGLGMGKGREGPEQAGVLRPRIYRYIRSPKLTCAKHQCNIDSIWGTKRSATTKHPGNILMKLQASAGTR